jgi:hypothetical protein
VNKPPAFTCVPESLTINEGEALILEARALGKPVPSISWKRKLEEVTAGVAANEEPERWEAGSQLSKTVAVEDDTDEWFIEATNSIGSVQHQFGLNGMLHIFTDPSLLH